MRILKYIFLLVLLVAIASSVFIATQKGDYEVSRSRIVNVSPAIAFDYVSDYANWPQWMIFEDGKVNYTFPTYSSEKTNSFKWNGSESSGEVQTISKSGTDSIKQRIIYDGNASLVTWTFKDTVGGTKITVATKGKMDFKSKFRAVKNGNADKFVGSFYENSLASLEKSLKHELKTFKVEVQGIVVKSAKYFIQQTIVSKDSKIINNSRIMRARLEAFAKENSIVADGQPFILYHYSDALNNTTKFSVCYPVKNEIFISEGSDMSSGHYDAFRAVKTTLTGNYTHLSAAWTKTVQYLNKNKLTQKGTLPRLELYKIGKEKFSSPTHWVTELYLPIDDAIASIDAPTATSYKPVTTSETPVKKDNLLEEKPRSESQIINKSKKDPVPQSKQEKVQPRKEPTIQPKKVPVAQPKKETEDSMKEFDF